MRHRSEEWLKGKLDEFFADTSRTPEELITCLDSAVKHICKLQETLRRDLAGKE